MSVFCRFGNRSFRSSYSLGETQCKYPLVMMLAFTGLGCHNKTSDVRRCRPVNQLPGRFPPLSS